jgi:hypothetical protein
MLYAKEFPSRIEMEYFMQDKVLGSIIFHALKTYNVRNLTLIFTTPVKTITFPDTLASETLKPAEIQAEAESQSAGRLYLVKPPGGPAGTLRFALLTEGDVTTGGTAAPVLGLPPTPGPVTVGANKLAIADVADVYYVEKSAQYGLVYDA